MIRRSVRLTAVTASAVLLLVVIMAGCSGSDPEPSAEPGTSPTAAGPSASASPNPSTPAPVVDDTAARESLADSISSGNTAALASWVSDPVLVTIAATEFSEQVTPDQAAVEVGYVVDLAATWNFALSDATLDTYRAGSYCQNFPADVLAGLSSTGAVIAFTMTDGEATGIFMCADELLLLP